jgi:DNA-binding MarR family transcriptional regulator
MSKGPTIPYERTLFVRDYCLCLHAQRAARTLARKFDAGLASLGLTSGQFSLMMSLNRPEPPSMGTVAAVLAMDRTTLTAALKPLERRGLVQLTTDSGDRRRRLMTLTAEGRTVLARAIPVWEQVHAEIDAILKDANADQLRSSLRALS